MIGPIDAPEPNINKLVLGPREWIYGSTEENGWLFIFDPATQEYVQWNAGRTTVPEGKLFEGDITDFVVWEEGGKLLIFACQAYPAEIYRYEIPLPTSGLPDPNAGIVEKVYENPEWGRVMSIARGSTIDGQVILLAGSQLKGELIRSNDQGLTWEPIRYLDDHHEAMKTWATTLSGLHFFRDPDTWMIFTRQAFLLDVETPWTNGLRHTINTVLVSYDGSQTWHFAQIAPNPRIPADFQAIIDADKTLGRLHPNLYGLVGENVGQWTRLGNGDLVATTTMSNYPEYPYGGRVLVSENAGQRWDEMSYFQEATDLSIAALPHRSQTLLAGTMTKMKTPPNGMATGDLYLSQNGGRTWTFLYRVVSTDKPSAFRRDIYVAGISAIVATPHGVLVGTVNEGEHGVLFWFDYDKLLPPLPLYMPIVTRH